MKRISLLLLLSPLIGFSQNFIGKNKIQVKKQLQEQIALSQSLAITLTDKDSELVYSISNKDALPADIIYSFDKSGKCQSEKVTAGTDSSFTKYLQTALAEKKYDWKKINENQYVSNYTSRMMIELPADSKDFTYIILRTEWTKELYAMLTGN